MTKKPALKEPAAESFESRLEKLRSIVETLEDGSLSLEDGIKVFQEGISLAHGLFLTLNDAEGRVEELLRTMDAMPFPKPQE
jgi:exodeoxyribonuclease VII small subunit